ncbi:MAG: YgjV family protein [Porticoccaceae bacterium]
MDIATNFGVLGVFANTIWPLIKNRQLFLMGQFVACTLMGIHFALLGATTGAIVVFFAGIQILLAVPLESHPKFKTVYLLSLLLTPLVCWYSWQGIPSIFSSLALLFFCIGNLQVRAKNMRILLILCIFGWIGHNLLIGSYPALVSNGLALITSIYGLHRENRPKMVCK